MSRTNLKGAISSLKREAIATESRLPLEEIQTRETDTRPLNQAHVEALAESIAALGLIQPIAVDSQGVLLAGGHRRAAIEHLQQSQPQAFDQWFASGVPVHRFDFDAAVDADLALAIEATENEKRRDYTPGEVRELADRLVAAGYHSGRGQPKKGSKAVGPTLEIITGKSQATIKRYLNPHKKSNSSPDPILFDKQAPKVAKSISKLLDAEDCPDDVAKLALRLLKKLE